MPICPEPGCNREMAEQRQWAIKSRVGANYPTGEYRCPSTPDQHRIAALEAELAETRKALEEADRALIVVHEDRGLSDDKSGWFGVRGAIEAALQRQAQRGKTGEGAE